MAYYPSRDFKVVRSSGFTRMTALTANRGSNLFTAKTIAKLIATVSRKYWAGHSTRQHRSHSTSSAPLPRTRYGLPVRRECSRRRYSNAKTISTGKPHRVALISSRCSSGAADQADSHIYIYSGAADRHSAPTPPSDTTA